MKNKKPNLWVFIGVFDEDTWILHECLLRECRTWALWCPVRCGGSREKIRTGKTDYTESFNCKNFFSSLPLNFFVGFVELTWAYFTTPPHIKWLDFITDIFCADIFTDIYPDGHFSTDLKLLCVLTFWISLICLDFVRNKTNNVAGTSQINDRLLPFRFRTVSFVWSAKSTTCLTSIL